MTTATAPIRNLDIREYGADRIPGCPAPTLNSGLATLLVNRSEHHAWYEAPKLNPEWQARTASDLMNVGSAAHAILLEDAGHRIVAIPYDDWRTGAAKELRDKALADGLIPLLSKDADVAQLMADHARTTLLTSPDLDGLGETRNELTYWWRETRVDHAGIDREAYLRCRPDMVSDDGTIIVSYKTTSQPAEPEAYFKTLLNAGHDMQAAFELSGVEAVEGTRVTHYVWLVGEMAPPYAVALIGMSPQLRHYGLARMDQAVLRWAESLERDRWPSYPERVVYPELPAWKLREIEELE